MNGSVIEFPRMRMRRAREIVRNPDLHSGSEVLAACQVLLERGGHEDVRAALALQVDGVVAGFERAEIDAVRGRYRRERRNILVGMCLLIAAAVGVTVIASWLFRAIAAVLS